MTKQRHIKSTFLWTKQIISEQKWWNDISDAFLTGGLNKKVDHIYKCTEKTQVVFAIIKYQKSNALCKYSFQIHEQYYGICPTKVPQYSLHLSMFIYRTWYVKSQTPHLTYSWNEASTVLKLIKKKDNHQMPQK